MNKPKFKVEHVAEALRTSGGIVSDAAQKLGCSPATVRNYIRRHKSLQHVLEEAIESNLDLAESALLKGIAQGNMTAVIFYLKTKGRGRGYVERSGVLDKDDKPADGPQYVVILPDNGRDRPAPPDELDPPETTPGATFATKADIAIYGGAAGAGQNLWTAS